MRRHLLLPCLIIAATTVATVIPGVHGDGPARLTDQAQSAREQKERRNRLREGAEIVDAVGSFEWIGDRLSFVSEDSDSALRILENRMMERVVVTLEGSTGELVWTVNGDVTEYRGSNYLLMSHVKLKGKRSE